MFKKILKTGLVAVMLLTSAQMAAAVPYTLNQSQLLGFKELAESPSLALTTLMTPNTALPGGGVEFTGMLGNLSSLATDYSITIGLDGTTTPAVTANLTGFDSYDLSIKNSNNSIWSYQLYLLAGGNTYTSPGFVSLIPGNSATLSLDFATISSTDLATVNAIGFTVMGHAVNTGGHPSDPDIFHVTAAPVPEPGTILLLGGGLLGLGLYGRKRAKKNA